MQKIRTTPSGLGIGAAQRVGGFSTLGDPRIGDYRLQGSRDILQILGTVPRTSGLRSAATGTASLAHRRDHFQSAATAAAPSGAKPLPDCSQDLHFASNPKESTSKWPSRDIFPTMGPVPRSGATGLASLAHRRQNFRSGATAAAPSGAKPLPDWSHGRNFVSNPKRSTSKWPSR